MKHEIFESNPSMKEFYLTSDGQKFYTLNAAANHARTLEDREVETITRDESDESEDSEEEDSPKNTIDALKLVSEDINAPVIELVETDEEDDQESETIKGSQESTTEEVKTEAPVVEEVKTEAPVVEEMKTEAPMVEEVKTEAPVVEEMKTEAPVVEEVKKEDVKPVAKKATKSKK